MEQETVVKVFNGASNEEIMEAAKELIENSNWVFEIYNDDELMLGVNAFENISNGYLTEGKTCVWGVFNKENPHLWDEFDTLHPECVDDYSYEEE